MLGYKKWLLGLCILLSSVIWAGEANTPLPGFRLHTLSGTTLSNKTFRGKVSLLNVWASWCRYCHYEHGMLLKIKNEFHVPIYGIALKDDPRDTQRWLKGHGNPYTLVGEDPSGEASDALQVYGTPETFVIDKKGVIRYQYNGAIDQSTWENTLWPLIQRLRNEK